MVVRPTSSWPAQSICDKFVADGAVGGWKSVSRLPGGGRRVQLNAWAHRLQHPRHSSTCTLAGTPGSQLGGTSTSLAGNKEAEKEKEKEEESKAITLFACLPSSASLMCLSQPPVAGPLLHMATALLCCLGSRKGAKMSLLHQQSLCISGTCSITRFTHVQNLGNGGLIWLQAHLLHTHNLQHSTTHDECEQH